VACLQFRGITTKIRMDEKDLLQSDEEELSLLETLDHVLNHGLVIAGEITISVADIDLIFVGLNVLLGSVDTIEEVLGHRKELTGDKHKDEG
jgi:gas vesicle structural protein